MLHISSKVTLARFARVSYSVIHECSASERSRGDTVAHELDFLEFCQVQLPLLLFPLLLLRGCLCMHAAPIQQPPPPTRQCLLFLAQWSGMWEGEDDPMHGRCPSPIHCSVKHVHGVARLLQVAL